MSQPQRVPTNRVSYSLPIAAPGNQITVPSKDSGNAFLAAKKDDRPAQKMWKMQADERLKLHKAYTNALQNKAANCFDLSKGGKAGDPDWLPTKAKGPKGKKVSRAMGGRWRRTQDQVGYQQSPGESGTVLEDVYRGDQEKSKRHRDRMTTESRRKRETWEIKSAAARDFKASQNTLKSHPWAENDHAHQARQLLSQTLKEREKLHSQNDRLISMAREVEVLSEKLRISEGLVAKHQTKLKNSEMFLRNMEMELESKVSKDKYDSVVHENTKLKAHIEEQKEHIARTEIRVSQLQNQLDTITQMQLMADEEEEDHSFDQHIPASPSASKQVDVSGQSGPPQLTSEEKGSADVSNVDTTDSNGNQPTTAAVRPVSVTIEMPNASKSAVNASVPQKRAAPFKQLNPTLFLSKKNEDPSTANAVTLLQQYIRNLISENQQLKKSLSSLEKTDPKRDLFPEFVQLKRQNLRMQKMLTKLGVEESAYTKKVR
eukprot:CAMPEP_0184498112 /NCGR_PEP_ID=MMETSP0113_2-20130426/38133_1 /TAXON_ID=91329 /ORGANISM="Norrisiella sphaerica, Strain BC52" /LENGTH=486 /DNA_ID=CAMNT_0026885485 /DNA_START=92 /DNA_END=1552 /DNA_ORIENTATION=-